MENRKGMIALLITVLIWASSFAVTKIGLQQIEPMTMAFIRAFFASVFLLFIICGKKQFKSFLCVVKTDWKYFLILAIIGIALFNIFQNIGVKYTSSALAGVLQNTNPLFILILSGIFLHEIITRKKIIGVVVGFLGMLIIVFGGVNINEIFKSQSFLGNVLIIGSSVSWAIYSILNKKVFKKYTPLHLTAIAYIFGTIFLFPIAFLFENTSTLFLFSIKSWLIVGYLGVVASGITFFLWNYALSKMEATKASVFLFLIPVIAILIGWLFMEEALTVYTITGSILILGGIYITEKK